MSTINPQLLREARSFVSTSFGGIPTLDMEVDAIVNAVAHLHPEGWDGFVASFHAVEAAVSGPAKSETISPVKLKALVTRAIHYCHGTAGCRDYAHKSRLSEYDTIELVDYFDRLEFTVIIRRAVLDRKSRRDNVTAWITEMHSFAAADDEGEPSHRVVTMTEAADEAFVRFGSVMTPERHEAIKEQFETCYRPGTAKSPMQGWVARLEVADADVHPDTAPNRYKMNG